MLPTHSEEDRFSVHKLAHTDSEACMCYYIKVGKDSLLRSSGLFRELYELFTNKTQIPEDGVLTDKKQSEKRD